MTDSGAAAGTRIPRTAWLVVLGAALLARETFALVTPRTIAWPDGREFEAVARSLIEHGTYGLQTLRPPGYPTLIAGIYALFGTDLLTLRLIEGVLGTVSVAIVGWVGAGLFGPRAGLIAAALMALHPVLAFLPSTQYSENVVVLALVLAFGAFFAAWRRGGPWRWALAGALFGVATLVRPNTVFLLPGLCLGTLLAPRGAAGARVIPGLIAVLALFATVAPWVIRGHQAHGRWYFIASGGGRQFWVGNNPRATAETTSPTQWNAAERESLARLEDELAQERWFYREGMRFVRAEPARAGRLYLKELGNLFALWPETFSRTRFANSWSRWTQGAASAVIFVGALLAIARLRGDPLLWPLLGAIVSYALMSALFFTVMRYRMVIEPCLVWLAGAGWAGTPWAAALSRRIGLDGMGLGPGQSVKR